MNKSFFLSVFVLCIGLLQTTYAQLVKTKKPKTIPHWEHRFTLALGLGKEMGAASLGYAAVYGFGESQRFHLGGGVRLNLALGITDSVPFCARNPKDSLLVEKPFLGSVNLGLYASYDINERWEIGASADLVGFGFGSPQNALLLNSQNEDSLNTTTQLRSFVRIPLGTLNNEVFVGYKFNRRWRLRVGLQYLMSEYLTPEKFFNEQDNYYNNAILGFIGITFTPFGETVNCPKPQKVKIKYLKEGEM